MNAALSGARSVGLDIGGTKVHGVVLDSDGTILAQVRESTELGPDGVLATAERVFDALRAATGLALTARVGVGVPGLVDAGRGVLRHAVNLGVDGDDLPLRDLLTDRLGVAVALENDVNVAALAAQALTGADDVVYLSVGTGLAAGLVVDGRLRRGEHGAAGEIGHVPVDPGGARCACGQQGCLETIASGAALAHAWTTQDEAPATAVFAAAERGDEKAIAVRDRFCWGVASAVRVLGLTVDPTSIVLGGGVSEVGDVLAEEVRCQLRAMEEGSPFLASLGLPDRLSVVPRGYPAAAVGAAILGR